MNTKTYLFEHTLKYSFYGLLRFSFIFEILLNVICSEQAL